MADLQRVREVQSAVVAAGHQLTLDWTRDTTLVDYGEHLVEAREIAAEDVDAVLSADAVLVVASEHEGRGVYVELGAALARASRGDLEHVVVVGDLRHESVFHFHPAVARVDSVHDWLATLQDDDAQSQSVLVTERLRLRPWNVSEAGVQRELWRQRDPRVPPHRRIDEVGRPTMAEFEDAIRHVDRSSLLAIELHEDGQIIGHAGLVEPVEDRVEGEPQVAFELLRRAWGRGYASETVAAVMNHARALGHRSLGPGYGSGTLRPCGCCPRRASRR